MVLLKRITNMLNHASQFLPQCILRYAHLIFKALKAHSRLTQPSKEGKNHHFTALA